MPKKIALIKTEARGFNPRLEKEIETLLGAGFSVDLICWDRDSCKPIDKSVKVKDFYREISFSFKAPRGPKILPFLPLWWCFEIFSILRNDFDIIHAIDFDTIMPAVIAAKIKGIPIIYEMYDIYVDEILLPSKIRNFLLIIDKLFMLLSNAIIIVDESRIQEVNGIPNKNIAIIYNASEDYTREKCISDSSNDFVLFYAGLLSKYRSLENVIKAVKALDDVKLIIAGYGDLVDLIERASKQNPNKIYFLGRIGHKEVLSRSCSSNLLFSLYDPIVPSYKFASSNKLFEAMMCSKPIIVSEGTPMENIVKKYNCGLSVNCRDYIQIKDAISKLKADERLCVKLGNNGRKAYEEEFNWQKMKERLINLYNNLL